jgi:hypothetical protein
MRFFALSTHRAWVLHYPIIIEHSHHGANGEHKGNRMKNTNVQGASVGLALVLYFGLMTFPTPALAAKTSCEQCGAQPAPRLTAAGVPKETRTGFSRISARRIHGVQSRSRQSAPRSLNHSRMRLAQQEQTLDPTRIRVIDGETFAYGKELIRVQGFNAVERVDAGGVGATQRLDQLLHEGHVTMIRTSTDSDGRIAAHLFVDRRNVAGLMRLGYKYPSMMT